jgi:glutamate racemase
MNILITDSGVGGLSVCAYAERYVRREGAAEQTLLTFANAAPANDYGYNSMPTLGEKLETFDRFLRSVTERFDPDLIYVACNTLSVLLPHTPFVSEARVAIAGIVDTAVELLMQRLAGDQTVVVILFGTQTTIDSGVYPRALTARGVDPSRILGQACPGLADVISEDREGSRVAAEITRWVSVAIERLERRDVPVVAALVCTHYGYRKDLFAEAFRANGITATILNPNELAVHDIFPAGSAGSFHEAEVEFVTRYAIPAETVEALTYFLGEISPKTVEAMRRFRLLPDLF